MKKNSMNKYVLLCGFGLMAISLSGCSGVKNSLGLEKEAPDEFAVLTRAPLEMPSKLILPPPKLGTPRPQEQTTIKQAKEALFGEVSGDISPSSSAEDMLLQKAQANDIDPNIRATINKETAELENRNKPVAEKLLNISGNNKRPSATVIDAKRELERIRKNKQEGKSITDGQSAIIEE